MELGSPAALWLLALVPLVLVAHRWRPQARTFVTTRHFWTAAAPAGVSPRAWRRDWLSLLLQILVLVAIVFALARPALVAGVDRVAVVIDLSLTMGARHDEVSRLDEARAAIVDLLARLPRGTHVQITGVHVEPVSVAQAVVGDPSIDTALGALRPTHVVADLEAAILFARRGGPSAVYVFTDRAPPSVMGRGVSWVAVGRAAGNVALTAITATRGEAERGRQIYLTIVNDGATAVEAPIVIDVDGVEARRAVIDLPPGASTTRVFSIDAAGGILSARVDRPDALDADNLRTLVLPPAGPARVQVVGAGGAVRRALAAHPGVRLVDADSAAIEAPDVIVCDGCEELPAARAGVLLLPPRGPAPPAIAPLVAERTDHPVLDALTIDGLAAAPLRSTRTIDEGTVLVRAAGGPAIAAYEAGGRRVVELRLDPDAAGLALDPAFPILLANAVEWVDARRARAHTIEAGAPIRLPATDDTGVPTVSGPDGLPVPAVVVDGTLTVAHTQLAGTYRIRQRDGETTVAVNPAVASAAERASLTVQTASSDATPPDPFRRDVTGALLLGALAALFAEWRVRKGERP